ncbi:MAG: hypothetical protein ACI9MC_001420, partial [Kiritimatiellia bacterium]
EEGDYKLVTRFAPDGDGVASLLMVPFTELNAKAVRLRELQPIVSTLDDYQQRSWWIEIKDRRPVAFEATGRHLADLRIWRDGSWLVDASPECSEFEPNEGQPWTDCQLTSTLQPGLYQVKAYGGPGRAWTEQSNAKPLHLQWSVPTHKTTLRQARTMGPQGFERFYLPRASFVRIELPQNAPATLEVANGNPTTPFSSPSHTQRITNENRLPVAQIVGRGTNKVVTVRATPGQPYILQHFEPIGDRTKMTGKGTWFLGTVHAGDPTDSVTPTGVLYRRSDNHTRVVTSAAIHLPGASSWKRRFNLLEPTRILLRFDESTTVRVDAPGDVRLRLEPFLVKKPKDYKRPELVDDHLEQHVDPGHYELTLLPKLAGVIDLHVQTKTGGGWATDSATPVVPRAAIQVPKLSLSQTPVTFFREEQPGVKVGRVLRKLPVDLGDPLPVTLLPGERIDLPSKVTTDGLLTVRDGHGKAWPFQLDGAHTTSARLGAGTFRVSLHNATDAPVQLSIQHTPMLRLPSTPLSTLSAKDLKRLPVFPALVVERPAYFDLNRAEQQTWLVKVATPGLYQFQSQGLLHTSAHVRTRTRLGFASGAGNGPGRNFMIERYLGAGTYQVSVSAIGRSAGHLGMGLKRTDLVDGGELRPDMPARITLPAGHAVAYTFHVAEAGRYHLRSAGRGSHLTCRIEDDEGWPVINPVVRCDRALDLDPGTYRVIVLPSDVQTRRLTQLTRHQPIAGFVGHGPHTLAPAAQVRHTWNESEERTPDVWSFALPAAADVRLSLTNDMVADVMFGDERVGRIAPGVDYSGPLQAGAYKLLVRSIRQDNDKPYSVRLDTEQLLRGQRRTLSLPASIDVAVGERELLTLSSFGNADVRARLYSNGVVIASNDDRPDDWNFLLTERLDPGRYTLRIDPVGGSGSTTVAMEARDVVTGNTLRTGESTSISLDRRVHQLQFTAAPGRLVVASADADETVEIALEARSNEVWSTIGSATGAHPTLAVRPPIHPVDGWRLRVRSLDDRGNPVTVRVDAQIGRTISERALDAGVSFRSGDAFDIVRVRTGTPGLFSIQGDRDLLVCTRAGAACGAITGPTVAVGAKGLWMTSSSGTVTMQRVRPGTVDIFASVTPDNDVYVDLPVGTGPVLLTATSTAGQPGVQLVGKLKSKGRSTKGMGVAPSAAVAVSLDGSARGGLLWSADGTPLELRLQARRFAEPAVQPVDSGVTSMILPAGEARRLRLPDGLLHDVRLALQRGLVAATEGGAQIHWASGASIDEHLPRLSDDIVVFNPTEDALALTAQVRPGTKWQGRMSAGKPIEISSDRVGSWRVPVAAGGNVKLRGAVQRAMLLRDDGVVETGLNLDVGPGGTLWVQHGRGTVLAWTDPLDKPTGPWANNNPIQVKSEPQGLIQMTGAQSVQLNFDFGHAGMVQVHLSQPFAARVHVADDEPRVDVLQEGGSVLAWMPEGRGVVQLRSLADTRIGGYAEVTTHQPTPLIEGAGDPVLLTPGGLALYSFTVTRDGAVGVGVRAEADRVDATIYTIDGERIGRGVLQMPELKAGRYLLALRLPPGSPPVRAQAVLVGIDPPDTGPPADVLRTYKSEPTR